MPYPGSDLYPGASSAGITVTQAVDELLNLHGLDVSRDEAVRLLNEAHIELCVRSEWTRAELELGPTVSAQAAYALPSSVYRPLEVYLNGRLLSPSDKETASRIGTELRLRSSGLWWLSFDANGVESVSVHPIPVTPDLSLAAFCVVYPVPLAEGAEFAVPWDFHRALIDYVRAVSMASSEDDLESENVALTAFESRVARLRRLRFARTGRGGVRMRISGVTA